MVPECAICQCICFDIDSIAVEPFCSSYFLIKCSGSSQRWEQSKQMTFFCEFIYEALIEPGRQKTGLRGFRPGPTQTGLYSHRRWLETWNFGFRKQRDCTIQVAKTKALISFAVTAKLICVFVFAYAKIRFSPVAAQLRAYYGTCLKESCQSAEELQTVS